MPDQIVPLVGMSPEKVLAKQQYNTVQVSQNMFSSPEKNKDKKVMLPPTKLQGVTIQKLWDHVFSDDSAFLQRYHARRKETNVCVGRWEYTPDKGSGYRFVSLVTTIEVPRAGTQTQLNEAHRFVYTATEAGRLVLVYQISSQTPSVPAGSSFRTEALCEIVADSPDAPCSIAFWGNCKKMSMSFSAIQYMAVPRALREMTAGYKMFVDMIMSELCEGEVAVAASTSCEGIPDRDQGSSFTDSHGSEREGSPEPVGMVFQGVLLLLACFVALMVISAIFTIRGTARATARLTAELQNADRGGGGGAHASVSSKWGERNSGSPDAFGQLMTEDQALRNAARDAQVQTLRFRWLEQRVAVEALEQSVRSLWWFGMLQMFVFIVILVRLFFFQQPAKAYAL